MEIEEQILNTYHTVCVVGLSNNPDRPSYTVARYLQSNGYRIIPVNPNEPRILEETSYPNVTSVPDPIEVVDIFRRSEDVLPIVVEAIKAKAKVIWMQEGVKNDEAAEYARKAGLLVVMDKCMSKEHIRIKENSWRK